MITLAEMLPYLASVCPTFSAEWKEHKQEYSAEENFLPYIALAKLAGHVIDLHFRGAQTEVMAVFDAVERLHLEGEHHVREAATIGFLESIRNQMGNNGKDPNILCQYLGPVSRSWWEQLNLFWDGKIRYLGETVDDKLR